MPASAAGHRNCTYQAVTSVQHQAAGDGYRSRVVTTTYRQCGQGHGKVIGVTYGAWGPVS